MALRNAFEDLATDAKMDMLILLLREISDKLPRTDSFDRVMVNTGDQGNVNVSIASGAVLSSVETLSGIGKNTLVCKEASAIPTQLSNVGAQHLYNHIIVD